MTRVDVRRSWQDYYADEEPEPPSWKLALAGGLAAASAVGLGMLLLRSTLQVRSVPERVLEWLLLFVPLDVFESGLQRFGFSAKRYALYFGIALMLALLAWLGGRRAAAALVACRCCSGWASACGCSRCWSSCR